MKLPWSKAKEPKLMICCNKCSASKWFSKDYSGRAGFRVFHHRIMFTMQGIGSKTCEGCQRAQTNTMLSLLNVLRAFKVV